MLYKNQNALQSDQACLKALHELRRWHRSTESWDSINRYINEYAVILCSGAMERSFKSIVADFVSEGCSSEVCQYLDESIRKCSVNPRIEEIKKILKKFNSSWKNAFGEEVKKLPPRCSESLKSLVEDRNHVAHGGTIASSFSDIVGYYCQARRVVSKLEDILPVVNPQE